MNEFVHNFYSFIYLPRCHSSGKKGSDDSGEVLNSLRWAMPVTITSNNINSILFSFASRAAKVKVSANVQRLVAVALSLFSLLIIVSLVRFVDYEALYSEVGAVTNGCIALLAIIPNFHLVYIPSISPFLTGSTKNWSARRLAAEERVDLRWVEGPTGNTTCRIGETEVGFYDILFFFWVYFFKV